MVPLFGYILSTALVVPVLVGCFALFTYLRGRSGADDMAFMVLKVYPAGPGEKRHVSAISSDTVQLKTVVENIILRYQIMWAFWRTKTKILLIPDKKFRRRVMSEFRHHLSCMFNKDIVGDWATDPNGLPFGEDIIRFAFSLSDLLSSHQRKIRVVTLPESDLQWIREHGVGGLILKPELEFLNTVLGDMVNYPDTIAHVGKIKTVLYVEKCKVQK